MFKRILCFKCLMLVGVAVLFAGCSSTDDSATGSYQSANVYDKPLFGRIARESMAYEGPARNPVIIVHGFLGARLQDKAGNDVWGKITGLEVMGGFPNDLLRELAHPMGIGKPLRKLKDDVKPVGVLTNFKIRLMGMKFNIAAYQSMIDLLEKGGYVWEGKPLPEGKSFYSLFTFYYDWRRDLPENAARLHEFIKEKRAYLKGRYKKLYGLSNYDVQFDVLAHSMGGLVSRYYLRYGDQDLPEEGLPKLDWRGSKHIDKLMIIGTPNAGYLDTCWEMIHGLQLEPGAPVYPPSIIATWPTYYQMMPPTYTRSVVWADDKNGKPVDMFDPKVWVDMGWGLVAPEQDQYLKVMLPDVKTKEERFKIALDHLTKCLKRAKKFIAAMKVIATPPDDVALFLFAGDAVMTRRSATVDRKTGEMKELVLSAGDGKVLSASARMDLREGREWEPYFISPIQWTAVIHLKAAHMAITESYSFADNAAFYLLSFPTGKQKKSKIYREAVEDFSKED